MESSGQEKNRRIIIQKKKDLTCVLHMYRSQRRRHCWETVMDFPVVSQDLLCADRGGNDIIIMLSWKFQVMALYSNRVIR